MHGRAIAAITAFCAAALISPAAAQPAAPPAPADGQNPFGAPFKWIVVPPPQPQQEAPPAETPSQTQPDPLAPTPEPIDASAPETPQQDPLAPLSDKTPSIYEPSAPAMQVMNWIAASGDNNGKPYIVLDKVAAELFVFDSDSKLVAASQALVGVATGDDSSPGVGDREMSDIPMDERTTPAGRFVAKFGPAAGHRTVLWVDFPTAISLHAVVTVPNEHRAERLKSATPDDNRITHGCINVPTKFYAKVVKPLFKDTSGVVYILPETKSLAEVFPAMPMPAAALQAHAAQ